jgi:hypothetical protein
MEAFEPDRNALPCISTDNNGSPFCLFFVRNKLSLQQYLTSVNKFSVFQVFW